VVRLDVHGAQARTPLLALLSQQLGVPVTLLHGGIDHVQDQPVGCLFVGVPHDGSDGFADTLAAALDARATDWEVLGHVAAHP
jgi:D-methionine transport system ATP-binding protein